MSPNKLFSDGRRLQLVVALSGAVLMSLEILGSRVLAPFYGSSVYVWGSLITTFLTALAAGYWLGGRLADRRPEAAAMSLILACAAVLVIPSVVWAPKLLASLAGSGMDPRSAALTASLLLFLPPSLAMGMVSPFAVRVAVRHVERVGSVAGGYSALSTAGSIVGTVATTFWLIPSFSVEHLLLALAATLAVCSVLLARGRSMATAALALGACGFAAWGQSAPGSIAGEKVLLSRDTAYHHISVSEVQGTRYLRFDNLQQSLIRLEKPDDTLAGSTEIFLLAWGLRPSIRRVAVIGLGGGTFSRNVERLVPGREIDSVEIDPVVVDIARQYFHYKDAPPEVSTFAEDGRVFLARGGKPYDLIALDAFNSTGVPFHLMTREFFDVVKKRLTPDGVFVANFLGRLMGSDARLFWASYHTIRRQFGQVYVVSPELVAGEKNPRATIIVLATVSADPVSPETLRKTVEALSVRWKVPRLPSYLPAWMHSPDPPAGTVELTDRYAPVEALQHF